MGLLLPLNRNPSLIIFLIFLRLRGKSNKGYFTFPVSYLILDVSLGNFKAPHYSQTTYINPMQTLEYTQQSVLQSYRNADRFKSALGKWSAYIHRKLSIGCSLLFARRFPIVNGAVPQAASFCSLHEVETY